MFFDDYDLDPAIYDEMFLPDGAPRQHCQRVHEELLRLSAEDLANIQDRVTRSFSNEGITFTVYGDEEADERIIPIDCLPRVMSGQEWRQLEAGLTQRLKALNRFLEDVYGDAAIIEDGVIPVDVVRGCPQYRTEMRGFSIPHGGPGWPFAAPIWCAPATDSACSRTTSGSLRVCPTCSPTARRSRPACAAFTATPGSGRWSTTAGCYWKLCGNWLRGEDRTQPSCS